MKNMPEGYYNIMQGDGAMKPKRKRSVLQSKSRYAYILITPGLLLISLIMIYPLVRGVISSFFTQKAASMHFEKFAGLRYYIELIGDKTFILSIKNSILYTFVVVAVQYFVGLAIALLLNKNFKGRGIYRSLILIPWVVPGISAAMTWKWMYDSQNGIINQILMKLGFITENIDWLGSQSTALWAVMVTSAWKAIPFVAIVLLATLQQVDQGLYEAVKIDGGTILHEFRYITLPGIKKISITTILLETIWTYNQFDLIFIMTKGGPANSSMIAPVYTYLTSFSFFKMNKAAAIGVISLIIVSIPAILYIHYNKKED
ncbi:MAG: sugar ABC transporter permease [Anaerolineaceae bacterium]|nr:MAG: sugar ABC transporter permease [Anaerolineaceae bacterium]